MEVKDLRVDRVGELVYLASGVLFPQELADRVGVFCAKEVPDGAAWLTVRSGRSVKHDVDGVGDIHVESSTTDLSLTLGK